MTTNKQIIDDLIRLACGNTYTHADAPNKPVLTRENIYAAVRDMQAIIGRPMIRPGAGKSVLSEHMMAQAKASFMGVKIIESSHCVQKVPVRKHESKGRNRSDSYHRRIQKKWNKRYGFRDEHVVYMLSGDVAVMHPQEIEKLRKLQTLQTLFNGVKVVIDEMPSPTIQR